MENIISINDLATGYDKKTILENININVSKGELIGIIGPNGSGKSTLLKAIRGILPKTKGTIKIFNKDVDDISDKEFALKVAYLQQNMIIGFGYTTKEIILTGRYPHKKWWQQDNENDEKIMNLCMEFTGVVDFKDIPINNLSGGQKQRVFLAKVLAQQTPILFLDEPTTGLDVFYQEEIFRFCKGLCEAGKSIIMVVHELSLAAKFCSRLLLIAQKGIIVDGEPEKVLTKENLSRAYGVQILVNKNKETGVLEVSTIPDAMELKKQKNLVSEVCAL